MDNPLNVMTTLITIGMFCLAFGYNWRAPGACVIDVWHAVHVRFHCLSVSSHYLRRR